MLAPGACSLRVACPTGEQGDGPGFSRPANRKVCLPTLSQLNREWPRCLFGQNALDVDVVAAATQTCGLPVELPTIGRRIILVPALSAGKSKHFGNSACSTARIRMAVPGSLLLISKGARCCIRSPPDEPPSTSSSYSGSAYCPSMWKWPVTMGAPVSGCPPPMLMV